MELRDDVKKPVSKVQTTEDSRAATAGMSSRKPDNKKKTPRKERKPKRNRNSEESDRRTKQKMGSLESTSQTKMTEYVSKNIKDIRAEATEIGTDGESSDGVFDSQEEYDDTSGDDTGSTTKWISKCKLWTVINL